MHTGLDTRRKKELVETNWKSDVVQSSQSKALISIGTSATEYVIVEDSGIQVTLSIYNFIGARTRSVGPAMAGPFST